jgi:hypothetical protein
MPPQSREEFILMNTTFQETRLERKQASFSLHKSVRIPPIVHEVIRSPGQRLDAATRTFMEPRLGYNFGSVRVHNDTRAAESARAVNAVAYTVGQNVVFSAGQFAPQSREGQKLLAHELTHVMQQQERTAPTGIDAPDSIYEREATRASEAVTSNLPLTLPITRTSAVLARQPENTPTDQPVQAAMGPELEPKQRPVLVIAVGDQSYVLYPNEVRTKGSSSWLANNPGNLDATDDTDEWGAFRGKKLPWGQHGFAIFPDEEAGLSAVRAYLRRNQRERDITLMMNMFAPMGDLANNPTKYAEAIAKKLNVPVNTLVKNMTDDQIKNFALEIQRVEGWKVGTTYTSRDDPALPDEVRGK